MTEWTAFHEKHADKIELVAGVDCWIWTGCTHPSGHGRVSSRSGHNYAHRAAYAAFCGSVPEKLMVRHMCGCAACVRPTHLKTGTALQNAQDTVSMGRIPTKLSREDVREIRRMYDQGVPMMGIADKFEIAYGTVYPIVSYRNFKHVDPEREGLHRRRQGRGLSDSDIAQARAMIADGVRNCDIARALGATSSAISNIKTGVRYGAR